ncbi:MAG: dihydrodipicolinate reductase [Pseudomonadota bacterium]
MDRTLVKACALGVAMIAATPLHAMEAISDRSTFMATLDGRELRLGLYGLSLNVTADGRIAGRAMGQSVSGDWSWQDGYFCREMLWGEREIPYNCQLVEAQGDRMRFTTDRGAGDSASFNLR